MGAFISFEGGDGSGKGTQSKLLYEYLTDEGVPTKLESFPRYQGPVGHLISAYLNSEFGEKVDPRLAGSLFSFDRLAAKDEIQNWVSNGGVYLADRFCDSNKGHQGGKLATEEERILFFETQDDFEHVELGIPKPDKTILFPMPAELAQSYIDQKMARAYTDKKRDLHEADPDHLRNANEAYLLLAKKNTDRITVIDPVEDSRTEMRSLESIHYDVVQAVRPLLEMRGVLRS